MSEFITAIQQDIVDRVRQSQPAWSAVELQPELLRLRNSYRTTVMPDFSTSQARLTYALAYHPFHSMMAYEVLSQSSHLLPIPEDGHLTVTALGAGPGAEVLALIRVLTQRVSPLQSIRLLLIDKEPGWKGTRQTTIEKTARRWWQGNLEIDHITADLGTESGREQMLEAVKQSQIVLAQAILSEIRIGNESVNLLANLVTVFPSDALLVLADFSAMDGLANWVTELDHHPTMRTVAATQQKFPMPMSGGDAAELFANQDGLRQRRQVSVTARMYSRPEWKPPVVAVGRDFALTVEQEEALALFQAFVLSDTAKVFILEGPAGSGKTEIMKSMVSIASENGKVATLLAPTGQAAVRLSRRSKMAAQTIHSALFEQSKVVDNDNETRQWPPTVEFKRRSISFENQVVLIDESSMIGDLQKLDEVEPPELKFGEGKLLTDIIDGVVKGGGKLVFVGDNCQLPPYAEDHSVALSSSDLIRRGLEVQTYSLNQVVRTDGDSEISELTRVLRSRVVNNDQGILPIEPSGKGEISKMTSVGLEPYLLDRFASGDAVALAVRNSDVAVWNDEIRQQQGKKSSRPEFGDRVVITKSNQTVGLVNGTDLEVIELLDLPVIKTLKSEQVELQKVRMRYVMSSGESLSFETFIVLDVLGAPDGETLRRVRQVLWVDFIVRMGALGIKKPSQDFWIAHENDPYVNALHVTYSYARTLFRAQGGEWDSVIVDGRSLLPTHSATPRQVYSAITRTKKALYLRWWLSGPREWDEDSLTQVPRSILQNAIAGRATTRRLPQSSLAIQIRPEDKGSNLNLNVYASNDGEVTCLLQNAPPEIENELKKQLDYWQVWERARKATVAPLPIQNGVSRIETMLGSETIDFFVIHSGSNQVEFLAFQRPEYASVRAYWNKKGEVTSLFNDSGSTELVLRLKAAIGSIWPKSTQVKN